MIVLNRFILCTLSALTVAAFFISSNLWFIRTENIKEQKFGQVVHPEQKRTDFRIIVITFNRPKSLQKLLASIDDIALDGDQGCLEIWIDRNKRNKIHSETFMVANSFNWKQGSTNVYVHKEHVGIYGQWIETWKLQRGNTTEIALILEDDLSISKYVYRWLKAVHTFYGPYNDFAGATLQSDEVVSHDGSDTRLRVQRQETVFMYKCIGTWGFSPKPSVWKSFQEWYSVHIKKPDFHPYVPGIVPTQWYEGLETTGEADSMWEMWFIYFAYKEKLYTLYSNLNEYNNDGKSCLSINRREDGRRESMELLWSSTTEELNYQPADGLRIPALRMHIRWFDKLPDRASSSTYEGLLDGSTIISHQRRIISPIPVLTLDATCFRNSERAVTMQH